MSRTTGRAPRVRRGPRSASQAEFVAGPAAGVAAASSGRGGGRSRDGDEEVGEHVGGNRPGHCRVPGSLSRDARASFCEGGGRGGEGPCPAPGWRLSPGPCGACADRVRVPRGECPPGGCGRPGREPEAGRRPPERRPAAPAAGERGGAAAAGTGGADPEQAGVRGVGRLHNCGAPRCRGCGVWGSREGTGRCVLGRRVRCCRVGGCVVCVEVPGAAEPRGRRWCRVRGWLIRGALRYRRCGVWGSPEGRGAAVSAGTRGCGARSPAAALRCRREPVLPGAVLSREADLGEWCFWVVLGPGHDLVHGGPRSAGPAEAGSNFGVVIFTGPTGAGARKRDPARGRRNVHYLGGGGGAEPEIVGVCRVAWAWGGRARRPWAGTRKGRPARPPEGPPGALRALLTLRPRP